METRTPELSPDPPQLHFPGSSKQSGAQLGRVLARAGQGRAPRVTVMRCTRVAKLEAEPRSGWARGHPAVTVTAL